ncbi:MAG: rRNA maturation RNase YbeY [Nitrosopumilus sp.]|nr:rRNA maturation RNase YbeY [Nitrosopumilus sp.]
MPIRFFNEDIFFSIGSPVKHKKWLIKVIEDEGYILSEINITFCSDRHLLKINKEFLNHDYFTDIITFDYSSGNTISGELFISVERVKENSKFHKNLFFEELDRVLIHGILHLLKYKDNNKPNIDTIRKKEDLWLSLRSF